ncbi:hypothetical protein [Bacillus sp. B1-b2]|uniref:hypothetical protein n=1 Tax=Bacillus sp. B1-b2 TaxID=2653201 RepID=UPI001261E245|nr:hypothetical protein [Bacillus sp. B1-b2]KAB7667149.1 hypothetical protein F9279_16280 [Bacillus sp. B1-b2]
MTTSTYNLEYGWKLNVHEKYDVFQGISDKSKYSITDSEHDSIGVFQLTGTSVDFIGSNYNLKPKIDFENKEIIIKHAPFEEDLE